MSRTAAKFFSLLVMLSIISLYMPVSLAQTQNTGAIQGRVFEGGSIAPLPGATVTVTHEEIGLERTTITNADGIYYVGILPAGRYRVSAARQGYQNDPNPENSIIQCPISWAHNWSMRRHKDGQLYQNSCDKQY